jgi:hypothetical protein
MFWLFAGGSKADIPYGESTVRSLKLKSSSEGHGCRSARCGKSDRIWEQESNPTAAIRPALAAYQSPWETAKSTYNLYGAKVNDIACVVIGLVILLTFFLAPFVGHGLKLWAQNAGMLVGVFLFVVGTLRLFVPAKKP